ncbi:hypothetical protein [Blastopirellula marina]|uniref:Methyl-accepting transducer domain-containing protein n=1 Tax=Blastopirellula marina TaxID=124 RepID=A0A2S8GDW0_9BACT|nr:hypothetical protein [Blastopirellula marina]PQO42629.1 hypothetical protein C5Y98_01975 [Blastopirellula marina]PTL46395.1 hypothetical protein C5Y97_01975 [Blastopirellula marina]
MTRGLKLSSFLLLIAVLPLCLPSSLLGQDTDAGSLRRKQYTQQQAQNLTRQLVSQVLDLQAAQLRQNGLTEVPIYSDILQMRENLDELIRNEMQGVVQKLVIAQQSEGQARLDAIVAARGEVRHVLLALMAERQRLYRRMRLARLHAQVRELISVQEQVTSQTRELPSLPMQSRDSAALANLSRQNDADGMFRQLEEVLSDMRGWGGSLAASAIASQQILKDTNASGELAGALQSIREGRYSGAAVHQDAFIVALYKILEDLQHAQGLADSSLEAAMNEIEKLHSEQLALQNETKQSELTDDKADELSQKQETIQRKLEELAKSMANQPESSQSLEEASHLAAEAVDQLFEADQDAAINKQDEVLAKLDSLKDQPLQQAVPPNVASADERAKQIAALEEAQQNLEQALTKQTAAQQQFETSPEQTSPVAQAQREAGQNLDAAVQAEHLPEGVKPMIAEAKSQANQAAAAAEDAASQNQTKTADSLKNATDSTRQALENVASTLADARRQQLATTIGELARAAEALDRAAAAQQEITRDATKLANDPQQAAGENLEALARTQSDIAAVANRVAAGTKNTAPQAAEAIKQAQNQIAQSSQAAQAMSQKQQSAEATGKQAQQLQAESRQAQQQLNQAANALRQAAQKAANQLANTADQQLGQIDSVDQALGELPSQQAPAAEQPQLEALANQAGMISPEAAARLRQPEENMTAEASANKNNPGQPSTNPMGATPSGTSSSQSQVQQARAELAGRRQPIAADKKAAEEIANLLENVSDSSERIQELSEQFLANAESPDSAEASPRNDGDESPLNPGEGAEPMPASSDSEQSAPQSPTAQNQVAAQLAEAMRQFAGSQRKATQLAANAAQQSQIANQPVREALHTASGLPMPEMPLGQQQAGKPTRESAGKPTPQPGDIAGEPSEGSSEPGSPSEGSSPSASQPAPAQPNHGPQQTAGMGTSMVSPTPQATAQALAGSQAMETLWGQMPELVADGDSSSQEVATIDPLGMAAPASAMLDNPTSSQSNSPTDAVASNAMQGENTNDQASSSQPVGSTNASSGDESTPSEAPGQGPGSGSSAPATRSFEKEPWFTKLPPGVQQSIRASVRRSPPPGYEERLRRYFEHVD